MRITTNAMNAFEQILKSNETANGIRIFIAGGCCTPAFQFELAENQDKEEVIEPVDGINFFFTEEVKEILAPVTLDHNGFGFLMSGLVKNECGCSH
ncbi:MAG: hypothetical protein ACP5O2_03440 [Bacteroidales bacterium]